MYLLASVSMEVVVDVFPRTAPVMIGCSVCTAVKAFHHEQGDRCVCLMCVTGVLFVCLYMTGVCLCVCVCLFKT